MGGTPAKCWWSRTKAATSLTAPSPGNTPLRTDSSPPELPRPLGLLRASGSCRQQHEGLQGFIRPSAWGVLQVGKLCRQKRQFLTEKRPLPYWYCHGNVLAQVCLSKSCCLPQMCGSRAQNTELPT